MECLFRFVSSPAPPPPPPQATSIVPPTMLFQKNIKRNRCLIRAQISDDKDPLLQSAINSASLRFHETHGRDPLFVDPYSGCFVSPHIRMDVENRSKHYCLATKFVDDKLLRTVNHMDGLKQMAWILDHIGLIGQAQPSFLMYPLKVYSKRPPKSSRVWGLRYREDICLKRASMEIDQAFGLYSFKEILLIVGGMATNGCLFVGELPAWLAETEFKNKSGTKNWMENLFSRKGFKVDMISYDEVAKRLGKVVKPEDYNNILFVAEQMRFSDHQKLGGESCRGWRMMAMRKGLRISKCKFILKHCPNQLYEQLNLIQRDKTNCCFR